MAPGRYRPEELKKLRALYQQSFTQNLTTYAALIGETFSSQINQLAQVIGDVHHLSLGTYKERLLASVIRKYIPKAYAVGTGFVLFPCEPTEPAKLPVGYDALNQSNFTVSKQCDILVYDAATYPVVFQDDAFVVLRPESVRAVVEVKGSLDDKEVASVVDHFLDFGKKWKNCSAFYQSHHQRA